MTNPPGQGNYPHINWIRDKPDQKTQEAQVHMSPLQKRLSSTNPNCVELEANKDKHWPGWKLVHTIA
jgi:hypothetical protein